MTMRKIFNSEGNPIIVGSTSTDKNLFPPGFRYRIGGIIYTVKSDCTQEIASPMREVFLSDGATEIIPVETIIRDIKEIENSRNRAAGEVMDPDERFVPKVAAPIKKKKVKKKAKKKVAKKKAKKKIGS